MRWICWMGRRNIRRHAWCYARNKSLLMRWLGFPSLEFFSEEGPARGIGKQVPHRAYRPIRNDIGFLLLALVSLALVPPRERRAGPSAARFSTLSPHVRGVDASLSPLRGLVILSLSFPRLAPWAAFWRRFAASRLHRPRCAWLDS